MKYEDYLRGEEIIMEFLTVHERSDKIKYCIIPKKSKILAGEKIIVSNNLNLINKFLEEEKDDREKS